MRDMFDWDEEKNRVNRAKHAIDFSIAAWVFQDPHWYGSEDRTATTVKTAIGRSAMSAIA
jgi:uncharacterized DUF497 family protein